MKSDFSRTSFDPAQQYTAMLHQQGRVITDADLNEQADIARHLHEALAASLTGNEGAIWLDPNAPPPVERRLAPRPVELRHLPGFRIVQGEASKTLQKLLREEKAPADADPATSSEESARLKEIDKAARDEAASQVAQLEGADWWISPGHYYAGGMRCENDAWVPVGAQPFLPEPDSQRQLPTDPERLYLFYLDAWERPRSWLDSPRLSDIALGAAVDTAMRAQLVWQVKSHPIDLKRQLRSDEDPGSPGAGLALPWDRPQPRLRVRIKSGARSNDPCRPAFASAWQGQENQFYRVEIHDGTPLPSTDTPARDLATQDSVVVSSGKDQPSKDTGVTFKWSRENGSVTARVSGLQGDAVTVFPGQLKAGGFRPGDRLEVAKDDDELGGRQGPMFIVVKVNGDSLTCEADAEGRKLSQVVVEGDKLRRWDQQPCGGTVLAVEHRWVELELGIEILFEPAAGMRQHIADGKGHTPTAGCFAGTEFRSGDHWCFAARTATADVDWPLEHSEVTHLDFAVSASLGDVPLTNSQSAPPVPVRLTGKPPAAAKDAAPAALPPHGVRHRYAILAIANPLERGRWVVDDLRRILHLCGKPATDASPTPPPQDNAKRRIFERLAPPSARSAALKEVSIKMAKSENDQLEEAAKLIESRLLENLDGAPKGRAAVAGATGRQRKK